MFLILLLWTPSLKYGSKLQGEYNIFKNGSGTLVGPILSPHSLSLRQFSWHFPFKVLKDKYDIFVVANLYSWVLPILICYLLGSYKRCVVFLFCFRFVLSFSIKSSLGRKYYTFFKVSQHNDCCFRTGGSKIPGQVLSLPPLPCMPSAVTNKGTSL